MPAPYAIADFCNAITDVLRDDAGRLLQAPDADVVSAYTPLVQRAIQQRYSLDCPLECLSDVVSDGSSILALPVFQGTVPDGGVVPVFDPEFSIVEVVEYPLGQYPPSTLMDSDFRLYRTPAGYSIMLSADLPDAGDPVRVTWTAQHAIDGSTVPNMHFFAVVDYAASLAADKLATIYAQTSDPTMSADVVNYRSKSAEYLQLSKSLRKRYFNAIGIDETKTGGSEVKASIALGNLYEDMASGVGRLVHQKYTR